MIELTPGQRLPLVSDDGRPVTSLRMCVGWDKEATAGAIGTGAPDVDLDASAVQFAGEQVFDFAFYNNLRTRDGSVVHLGDNQTGRGDGDDEQIEVDLMRVHAPVDTIVLLVSSYQGHSLEWISNAYCRLVGDDGVEIARLTLTLGVPQTGLVMASLVRDRDRDRDGDGDRWAVRAIGEGIAATVPTESVDALRRFV